MNRRNSPSIIASKEAHTHTHTFTHTHTHTNTHTHTHACRRHARTHTRAQWRWHAPAGMHACSCCFQSCLLAPRTTQVHSSNVQLWRGIQALACALLLLNSMEQKWKAAPTSSLSTSTSSVSGRVYSNARWCLSFCSIMPDPVCPHLLCQTSMYSLFPPLQMQRAC